MMLAAEQALTLAKRVIIVPGYGLAVASAQSTVADLVASLRKNGVDVKFGIHPGTLSGHACHSLLLWRATLITRVAYHC